LAAGLPAEVADRCHGRDLPLLSGRDAGVACHLVSTLERVTR
jgi:hypothetical protein